MLKVCIISERNWLAELLKQQFKDIEITAKNLANVIIDDTLENLSVNFSNNVSKLNKPVSLDALFEIIKQAKQSLQNYISIGPFLFYPEQKLCKLGDDEITLTQKETDIILYLVKRKGEVDKQTMLNEIWGYSEDISTHTLETHIYNLRTKFFNKYDLILSNNSGYMINSN